MPASASPERIAVLRGLGAELVLTDPDAGVDGAMAWVAAQVERHPERYFWANQYDNPANWQAHFRTTGPEIARQTKGRVTHVVAGTGTGGTLTGVGRYLRSVLPEVRLFGVQPAGGAERIPGLKHMATAQRRPQVYDESLLDGVVYVQAAQAQAMARRLAREEGLFVGPSAAAAVWAACEVAAGLKEGTVVVILPDAGYKYLSSPLWAGARAAA
jgi:cysteine synthase B